jgi:hypothetical protein
MAELSAEQKKAREIEDALRDRKAADAAKARRDAEGEESIGPSLATLTASIQKLTGLLAGKSGEDGEDDEDDVDDDDKVTAENRKRGEDGQQGRDGSTGRKPGDATELVADAAKKSGFSEQAKFADAQQQADRIYTGFSQSAPPPMAGEQLLNYRKRLLRPLQQHSKEFSAVDLARLDRQTLAGVESRIYADAMQVASNPSNLCGRGEMRAVQHRDATGRQITEYFGDPRAWLDDFAPPVEHRLVKINQSSKDRNGD